MKHLAAILIVFPCIWSIGSAAPLDHRQVPADSAWVVHVDFERFHQTRIGELVTAQITEKHKEKIDALAQLLGSNVLTDLTSLTLYGPDGHEENAVSLVKGRFDKDKLVAFLKLNSAYSESVYEGKTLYSWVDEHRRKNQVGAFAADNVIAISQTSSALQAALDVLAQKGKSLADKEQPRLYTLSQAPEGSFVVAAAEGLSRLGGPEHAAILNNSNFLVFITSEQDARLKARLQLESQTEESALQIEQIVRGMLAFVTLQLNDQPQMQKLVQSCIITRDGANLTFDLTVASQDFFALVKSMEPTPSSKDDNGARSNPS
ncbi:MAG: DUF4315 family protein [Planctomycetaceae bacterium]|nr:DUF4315 family protein [Planctomycetaceae bacterium]